ncbi:MAG: flagellar basal-body MS-ring/collar protein FliF [Caulobacteraceae bacterium]
MNAFSGLVQRFGIGRLVAILGVSAGVAAALFAIVLHFGAAPKSLLYSNLDLKEAGEITQALEQANVKYEVKGDGSTILVERDKVASTRLLLSGKGMPTSGSVGYELFDNAPALGQTDFVQNLNRQRALEGELARTIRSLQGISSARVHLVLPKRQLFEDEAEQPSASVVIGGARTPGGGEVAAIRNLIAGAVPNLKAERVTIVDDKGKMLAGGDGDGSADALAQDQRNSSEDRIRKMVVNLVEGVVGPGKARVQVSADVDLARVTTSEETFDPDGQVVRSTQTSEKKADENKANSSVGTSAASNIPGAATPSAPNAAGSTSGETEETTNYEISKKTRTEVVEPGAIKRLSVAVAVDGVTTEGKKGATTYAPRSPEEMKRIESLVRSAVGFDQSRGDQVTVVNVRFDRDAVTDAGTKAGNPLFDFDKNDLMRGGELIVLLAVGLLMIFFVARPLLKGIGSGGGGGGFMPMLVQGPGGVTTTQMVATNGAPMQVGADGQATPIALLPSELDQRINISQIEGHVKASSVKRVAEFVDKHPDESVSILRSWLHESA